MVEYDLDVRQGLCFTCGNYDQETYKCCKDPVSVEKRRDEWCTYWIKRPDGKRTVVPPVGSISMSHTSTGRLDHQTIKSTADRSDKKSKTEILQ